MRIYHMGPIDFWAGWLPEADYIEQVVRNDYQPDAVSELVSYTKFRSQAMVAAKAKLHWDGDIREGPFVSAVAPKCGDCAGSVMVAWKQDNNGVTYLASPVALPWVEGDSVEFYDLDD